MRTHDTRDRRGNKYVSHLATIRLVFYVKPKDNVISLVFYVIPQMITSYGLVCYVIPNRISS